MKASLELLELFKERKHLRSDSEAATALRITKGAISNWRTRENAGADAETVARMCAAIDEPIGQWLLRIQSDRETSDKAKKIWLETAKMLGYAATLFLAVYTAIPGSANAERALPSSSDGLPMAVYYVNY